MRAVRRKSVSSHAVTLTAVTRRKAPSTPTTRKGRTRAPDGGAAAGPARSGNAFERSIVRRATVWLVAVKAAGLVLLFDPWSIQAQDLPKSLFSRATEWLLVAALVLLVARFGPACIPRTRLHLLVVAFAGATAVSAVFAADGYVALYGARERYLGMTFIVDMLVLYAAVAIAFRSDADWRVLGVAAAAAGLVAVGYAGVQYAGLDPVRWADDPRVRPYGTFGNPDMFGHFLGVLFAVGLALAAFSQGRVTSPPRLAGAALMAIGVAVASVIATRATFIGISAALVAAGAVYLGLRGLERRAAIRLVLAGAVTVSLALGVLVLTPLGERLGATAGAVVGLAQGRAEEQIGAGALRDRLLIYDSAIRAFADRPLTGYGPDGFVVAYPAYRQPGSSAIFGQNSSQSSTHSWLLHTLVSHGIAGLATLLALVAASTWALWRALPSRPLVAGAALLAAAAYWAEGLVSVGAVGVDWIPWVVFGAAAATTAGPLPQRAARRIPVVAGAGAFAVAAALALTGLPALQAAHDAWNAQGWLSRGNADRAIEAAQSSVARDPGRADYWNRYGQALDLRELWARSADAYAQAARRAPYEATYWENVALTRGRLALQQPDRSGEVAAALGAARTAIERDPNAQRPHLTLAQLARAFGDLRLALTESVNAIALGGDPLADTIAAEAAVALGDPPLARERLEAALRHRETVATRLALAEVGLTMKDTTVARINATRVLELDPANERAKAILRAVSGG